METVPSPTPLIAFSYSSSSLKLRGTMTCAIFPRVRRESISRRELELSCRCVRKWRRALCCVSNPGFKQMSTPLALRILERYCPSLHAWAPPAARPILRWSGSCRSWSAYRLTPPNRACTGVHRLARDRRRRDRRRGGGHLPSGARHGRCRRLRPMAWPRSRAWGVCDCPHASLASMRHGANAFCDGAAATLAASSCAMCH